MELKKGINSIFSLLDDDTDKILAIAEKINLSKNEILIQQLQINKYIYFLEEGICRIYYPKELKDIINKEMNSLLKMIENRENPFNFTYINNYIMKYFDLIFENNDHS